jgi:hypothetical protein
MTLKTLGFKAALVTAVVAGAVSTSSAAKAFSVGDTLQFTSGADIVKFDFDGMPDRLNFGNNTFDPTGAAANSLGKIIVSTSEGGFAAYSGTTGSIKDLGLNPATPLPLKNFITIGNLSFELKNFFYGTSPTPGKFDSFNLTIEGIFRNGGKSLGEGLLTAQFKDGKKSGLSSYSGSFVVTEIPTPALLPGLVGLGMGVLRKRKKEMAEANAEV